MTRILLAAALGSLLVSSATAAPVPLLRPALVRHVQTLVTQLGAADFRDREAAEKALTQLGPDVFAIVDRLPRTTDAEVQTRLDRVRRKLLGFLDDIRVGLAELPAFPDRDNRKDVPEWLVTTVRKNQPRSGDLLLSIVKDRKHPRHLAAIAAFVRCWEDMSAAQLKTYVHEVMTASAFPRSHYPRGVEGGIETRHWVAYGWACWPDQNKLKFTARSQAIVDGKPVGKPYTYAGPGATTDWIQTKALAVGKHTCALEVEYTLTHRGETVTDRLRSADYDFTMLPEGTPDDLIAPFDEATDKLVRGAVTFRGKEPEIQGFQRFELPNAKPAPSVMWQDAKGRWDGLICPRWDVTQPLPLDLCFDLELHDLKTKAVYPGGSAIRLKGETGWNYAYPHDVHVFAKDRPAGDVQVQVVLKPSRKWALYNPQVTKYFAGEVKSEPLTLTVLRDYKTDQRRFDR